MNVKIVSGFWGYCPYKDLFLANIGEYAAIHGYSTAYYDREQKDWINDRWMPGRGLPLSRHLAWHKVDTILRELSSCDLLVWLDTDCVVTNMTRRMEDVIPVEAAVAMVKEDCPQTGCVLVRNNDAGRQFIEDWWNWGDPSSPVWTGYQGEPPIDNDNMTLAETCDRHPDIDARFYKLRNKEFAVKNVHWERGDFIMHVPGCYDYQKVEFMTLGMANVVR